MLKKKGTKLHFKSPTAERRHVLCVGVGGDRTHASRPGGAGYAPFANSARGNNMPNMPNMPNMQNNMQSNMQKYGKKE